MSQKTPQSNKNTTITTTDGPWWPMTCCFSLCPGSDPHLCRQLASAVPVFCCYSIMSLGSPCLRGSKTLSCYISLTIMRIITAEQTGTNTESVPAQPRLGRRECGAVQEHKSVENWRQLWTGLSCEIGSIVILMKTLWAGDAELWLVINLTPDAFGRPMGQKSTQKEGYIANSVPYYIRLHLCFFSLRKKGYSAHIITPLVSS